MKLFFLILIVFNAFYMYSQNYDGYYEGMERMCWKNENGKTEYYDPPRRWYHYNHLTIKNDSVYLYRCPVILHRRDTLHSASDGAFYYHYGRILRTDTGDVVDFYLKKCDYCAIKKVKDPVTGKLLPVQSHDIYKIATIKGGYEINGVKYGRKLKSGKD